LIASIVVLGLPKAGKSSFIAALSHVLQFKEIETALTLDHLSDEGRYIFEIRADWQACKPFERTKGGTVHPIVFNLRDESGHRGAISFPDIVGEEFEEQWSGRQWSLDFLATIETATGLLLFINPLTLTKPLSIADVADAESAALNLLGGEDSDDVDVNRNARTRHLPEMSAGEAIAREVTAQAEETKNASGTPSLWDPRKADAQTKLVDILQSVAIFKDGQRWTLGVVVSAWDAVEMHLPTMLPSRWL
jgi:GTPase SAR1 family protein